MAMTSLTVILGALSVAGSLALPGSAPTTACPPPALTGACQPSPAAYVRDFRANWPHVNATSTAILATGQSLADGIRAGRTWTELVAIAARTYGPTIAPGVVSLTAADLAPGVPIKR